MAKTAYTGSTGGASPQEKTAAKQAVAQEAIAAAKNTTTKDISNAAVSIGANAAKPATATASKTNTIAMSNDFSGANAAKPASTGSGSGNGSYSSVPLTDGNNSRYGGVPLNNTSSGAASDNGSGAATPASTTPAAAPEAAKPDVIYDPNWLNGEYVGPSGGGSTTTAPADGATSTEPTVPAEPSPTQEELLAQQWAEAGDVTKRLVEGATPEEIGLDRIDKIDTAELENMLAQIKAAQEQQAQGKIDYGVEQGVNELNRAMEDADPMFQARRNQIAADEQRALDNQVLYSEARGDRGGIGQSQYASIQNTAAVNQYKVSQEQTKLATDTARQIADLRAQGEFEKADALLDITQNYLGELMNLKQYAINTNMSVDEFNTKLAQWEAEYDLAARQYMANLEMSAANITGAFSDGTPTLSAQRNLQAQLAEAGMAMMQMGLEPTDAQIEAMGWTKDQYAAYKAQRDLENAAAAGGGYGGYSDYYYNRVDNMNIPSSYVAELQEALGIKADGMIGDATRAAAAANGIDLEATAAQFTNSK